MRPVGRHPGHRGHPGQLHGVHVPWVNSASEAAVRSVKYRPRGSRGLAGVRAADFGQSEPLGDYVRRANEPLMCPMSRIFVSAYVIARWSATRSCCGPTTSWASTRDHVRGRLVPHGRINASVTTLSNGIKARSGQLQGLSEKRPR